MNFKLTRIRQHFNQHTLADVAAETRKELARFSAKLHPGDAIAVAVGSRGIDNLYAVVRETVSFLKDKGAEPFIVPAMGSHGGATAEGQLAILEDYGISEKNIGVPVRSSMDVVEIPGGQDPGTLYMDKHAFHSDGIILVNKIKPHTDFRGKYESGLVKMAVIGLGKEKGAVAIHQYGVYGLAELLPLAARKIFSTGKILGGIALIENAYDKTMMVRALLSDEIPDLEPDLLDIARKHRPVFPVGNFDLLILDRMGKNISGVGIDTNIIGRLKIHGQPEPSDPHIKSILVSDLTDESHGNATGMGLADVITRRLADKIDFKITYTNIITSSFLERGKQPIVADTDLEALAVAMRSCGNIPPGRERIIRVRDTLHLDELLVSADILKEIKERDDIRVIETDINLLDEKGNFNLF